MPGRWPGRNKSWIKCCSISPSKLTSELCGVRNVVKVMKFYLSNAFAMFERMPYLKQIAKPFLGQANFCPFLARIRFLQFDLKSIPKKANTSKNGRFVKLFSVYFFFYQRRFRYWHYHHRLSSVKINTLYSQNEILIQFDLIRSDWIPDRKIWLNEHLTEWT